MKSSTSFVEVGPMMSMSLLFLPSKELKFFFGGMNLFYYLKRYWREKGIELVSNNKVIFYGLIIYVQRGLFWFFRIFNVYEVPDVFPYFFEFFFHFQGRIWNSFVYIDFTTEFLYVLNLIWNSFFFIWSVDLQNFLQVFIFHINRF